MMESRAIVILYSGKETPAAVIEAIGNTLVANGVCIPELLQIKVLDADSVASAIVARTVACDTKQRDKDALEHAMKFLSTTFETEIRIANGSDVLGICVLDRAVRKCISNVNYGFKTELRAALEIIKAETISTSQKLCEAHGWSLNVWKVFKQAAEGYV